jgi:pSer/pThr/pTyr-binding forkhead associated (FHA) protein
VIICSKCGKENQDRYKFCLGCGAQLTSLNPPPEAEQPAPVPGPGPAQAPAQAPAEGAAGPAFTPISPTPPAGLPKVGSAAALAVTEPEQPDPPATRPPMDAALSPPEAGSKVPTAQHASAGMASCPQCGSKNPQEFVFCGNCGARLKEAGPRTMGSSSGSGTDASAAPASVPLGKLALIKPDGSEGGDHVLMSQETVIGRGSGPLFDNDSYLSPRHAILTFEDGQLVLEDAASLNGVFVKIIQEERLADGDIFRIGQELLRFDVINEPRTLDDGTEVMGSPNPGYTGRLSIIVGPGIDGSAFPLMGEEVVLGRERGDILFSDDGYVSGTHAKISIRQDGFYLSDLGSSNGTFIKINEPRLISSGTFVLLGQQLFRVDHG